MGCNTSQEQKSSIAENGDGAATEDNQENNKKETDTKSDKKSAKSEKLVNGHAEAENNKDAGKLKKLQKKVCFIFGIPTWDRSSQTHVRKRAKQFLGIY